MATFILFDVRMRNNSAHERWKSLKFPLFLSFVFYPRPWAKYPPEVCVCVLKAKVMDGRGEKVRKKWKDFFKLHTGRAMQCRLNRALTSASTPRIEDKDPAPQFTSFNRMDKPFGSGALWLCYSMRNPNPSWRKLTFNDNIFTVVKIHNSFDLLIQRVSTIDRDRWMYLRLTRNMEKSEICHSICLCLHFFIFFVNDFLGFSGPPHLKWSWVALSFLAEMFKPAALKQCPSAWSFLPKDDNSQCPRGYNYSLPSFLRVEHLTIWKLNSVKENTLRQEESQKSDSLFLLRREVAENLKKKDLSEDRRNSTKWKIAVQNSISRILRSYCMRCEADVSSDRQVIWSHSPHNTCQTPVFHCR